MTLTKTSMTIFILMGDFVTATSQKFLLEAHNHFVEIIENDGRSDMSYVDNDDILLVDISTQYPKNYRVLDRLLKTRPRPKLLITANEDHGLAKDDIFAGGAVKILFKPYPPSDLLTAIADLDAR